MKAREKISPGPSSSKTGWQRQGRTSLATAPTRTRRPSLPMRHLSPAGLLHAALYVVSLFALPLFIRFRRSDTGKEVLFRPNIRRIHDIFPYPERREAPCRRTICVAPVRHSARSCTAKSGSSPSLSAQPEKGLHAPRGKIPRAFSYASTIPAGGMPFPAFL